MSRRSSPTIKADQDVVVARSAMFTCSDATQQEIVQDAKEQGLDALVVASCSPKLHTVTFRDVAKRAGMNPFQYTQVNVREQCSWTHTDDKPGATEKAVRLVRAGINRTRLTEPLEPIVVRDHAQEPRRRRRRRRPARRPGTGRDRAGRLPRREGSRISAAGWPASATCTRTAATAPSSIATLRQKVRANPAVTVFTNAELVSKTGSFGNYQVDRRGAAASASRPSQVTSAPSSWPPASTTTSRPPASSATASTAWSHCPSSRSWWTRRRARCTYNGRPVKTHRLHLLRGQPAGRERRRRPHLLLALLLHGRRPRGAAGRRQGRRRPAPVPPVPRHAHLRQVRTALEPSPASRARCTCACPTTSRRRSRSCPPAA